MLTNLFLLICIAALAVAIWRSHKKNIDTWEYIKAKAFKWWMKKASKV